MDARFTGLVRPVPDSTPVMAPIFMLSKSGYVGSHATKD